MLIRTRLTGARYSALRCRLQSRGSLRGLPRSSDVICGIGATAPRVRPQPNRRSSTTDRGSNYLTSRTNQNRISRPKWLIFPKRRARPVPLSERDVIHCEGRGSSRIRNLRGTPNPLFPVVLFARRWARGRAAPPWIGGIRRKDLRAGTVRHADFGAKAACGARCNPA